MGDAQFTTLCKNAIIDYVNSRLDCTNGRQITADDIYVVWLAKVLQNNKALMSTTLSDGMYYELTYNGDKDQLYLDAYKKWENVCINAASQS